VHLQAAAALLRNSLKSFPSFVPTSFERGDLGEAARRYREILQLFPDDPVARPLLRICSADGPAAEAVDSL
jgi:hypothetical protein